MNKNITKYIIFGLLACISSACGKVKTDKEPSVTEAIKTDPKTKNKTEKPEVQKNIPDDQQHRVEPEDQTVAGPGLSMTSVVLKDRTLSESDKDGNFITLKIKNEAPAQIEITGIPEQITGSAYSLEQSTHFTKSCEVNKKIDSQDECNIYYELKANKAGEIPLNSEIKISYQVANEKTRTITGTITGSIDWLTKAQIEQELKLEATKIASPDAASLIFTIKNNGQYPADISWKNALSYGSDLTNQPNPVDWNSGKTTCRNKDDWDKTFILAPGAECQLALIALSALSAKDIKYNYSVLGAPGKIALPNK